MGSKIDRTGEVSYNTFGSKIVITRYRTNKDIDIYFPEYNWTAKNVEYKQFKNGGIKCPYERRTYDVGYLGEGEYKTKINGKQTKCYITWCKMLQRCYDPKYHEKYPTYVDCEVDKEWLDYQDFGKWFTDNYYEIKGERMCLDKDILNKGNKTYSPENCIFVPNNINVLFIKCDNSRGEYPIGVNYDKQHDKFRAQCNIYDYEINKKKNLGYYESPQKAFEVYKQFKENNIKEVADYYKDLIPEKLYRAMYEYEVNIND